MTVEIAIMGENKAREESGILKEIRRIETREKEVIQALERNDGITWEEDGLVIHGRKNLCTKQQEGQGGNSKGKP